MALREANILFKDQIAGHLNETANGGTRFTYVPGWDQDIACCLPATRREHEWSQGLHPLFQNLGTEGWLREQQARVAHVVEEDDLGLLLRYGADCIGAVSVTPSDDAEPLPEITEATASPGRTVSGVQKKLLVVKDGETGEFHPAPAHGPAPYIAKFNSESIGDLVRNEALSLRWVTKMLRPGEVTEFEVAKVAILDEMALVVTRFDRLETGGKLRLEDCAQILCKPKGLDYSGKYDGDYEEVAEIIVRYSALPVIDMERFFRQLIASTLVGNCDAHLKNFSLLESPSGLRLSPAYDILNTAISEKHDRLLALSFNGKRIHLDEADTDLFRSFGNRIALPEKAIDRALAELRRRARGVASIIAPPEGEAPDGFRHRFSEIVSNACLRILGE